MTALVVLRAGPVCTVQDGGRRGYLRFGVTPAGPMDWTRHHAANLLAGNPADAAAIEIGPGGLSVRAADVPLRLGVSAAGFRLRRDGSDLPSRATVVLNPGARLDIEPGTSGVWAYLSVLGGFAEPPVMGSMATHLRSGLGPFGGRALSDGQELTVACRAAGTEEAGLWERLPPDPGPIRFVPGPQDDHFAPGVVAGLAAATYTLARHSDRMAYRLSGPPLAHARGHDIVSDGIAMGAMQVPGDGLPLVLMADRQPTGGYPKIGTVIRADLPRLAQLRPGQSLRLAPVTVEAAVQALRDATADLANLRGRLRPIRYVRGLGPAAGGPAV